MQLNFALLVYCNIRYHQSNICNVCITKWYLNVLRFLFGETDGQRNRWAFGVKINYSLVCYSMFCWDSYYFLSRFVIGPKLFTFYSLDGCCIDFGSSSSWRRLFPVEDERRQVDALSERFAPILCFVSLSFRYCFFHRCRPPIWPHSLLDCLCVHRSAQTSHDCSACHLPTGHISSHPTFHLVNSRHNDSYIL